MAVAVEIDREDVVGRRDELGLAHGACPGTDHARDRNVAALKDAERRDELLAPELAEAPPE